MEPAGSCFNNNIDDDGVDVICCYWFLLASNQTEALDQHLAAFHNAVQLLTRCFHLIHFFEVLGCNVPHPIHPHEWVYLQVLIPHPVQSLEPKVKSQVVVCGHFGVQLVVDPFADSFFQILF